MLSSGVERQKWSETKRAGDIFVRSSRLWPLGITLAVFACVLVFFLLFRPTLRAIHFGQTEKYKWQKIVVNPTVSGEPVLPRMENLPDIIENCRSTFARHNIEVTALNMESLSGEGNKNPGPLAYALFRFHLRGEWQRIYSALGELEIMRNYTIHVQEVALDGQGGECQLQIYFQTQTKHIPQSTATDT